MNMRSSSNRISARNPLLLPSLWSLILSVCLYNFCLDGRSYTATVSHWHHDHVAGLPSVLSLLEKLSSPRPKIHKHSADPTKDKDLPEASSYLPLKENQTFSVSGSEHHLRVLHTPGHSSDSISLVFPTQGIFTADTVLGEGTAVFEDLRVYMQSLDKLLNVCKGNAEKTRLFPGHGPVQEGGKEYVQMYIKHRSEREDSIVKAMSEEMDLMRYASPYPATIGTS